VVVLEEDVPLVRIEVGREWEDSLGNVGGSKASSG
jgi:hypothetical protein